MEYRDSIKDKLTAYHHEYYMKHKEALVEHHRVYRKTVRESDIEKAREKGRESYSRYKDVLNTNRRQKRADNPDEAHAQDKKYRDKYREQYKQRAAEKVVCAVCGVEHRRDAVSRHAKTRLHQQALLNLA